MSSIEQLIVEMKTDPVLTADVFKDVVTKGMDLKVTGEPPRKYLILDGHRFEVLVVENSWTAWVDGEEVALAAN